MDEIIRKQSSHRPFLTIGIASYNYAEYLQRAFEQIKKQEFKDIEVLYCDDGSTDSSQEIINGFIRANPDINIRLIVGENSGILYNRNRIVNNAQGLYLMICDADDYMLDTCLSELCSVALDADADCIIGGFVEVDKNGYTLKKHIPSARSSKWLYTWHHAQIYRTDLIHRYALHFEELPDDVLFLQNVHFYSKRTAFVPKPLYAWVRHSDSVSKNIVDNPDWNQLDIWTKLSQSVVSLQSSLQDDADKWDLNYYLYKWFYFNVCDLSVYKFVDLKQNIYRMRKQMVTVYPNYSSLSSLLYALRTQDTCFAHMAVFLCWILDRAGVLPIISFLRTGQQKIRKLRE